MIRDVAGSYRRALAETVRHYCGWLPDAATVDALKSEGCWNNDWDASLELLRRHGHRPLPDRDALIAVFSRFYFGGDPLGDPSQWRGFIGQEPLLVEPRLFERLSQAGVAWGFVSGAEPPSARYVLEERLGLAAPPLVAMGDAPDKPNPTGLLRLAQTLAGTELGSPASPPVAYLGDTVADVLTVVRARQAQPQQRFLALGVAPPHLHGAGQGRRAYEETLRASGADGVIASTNSVLASLERLIAPSPPGS
ncbi:HAD superfamily (subfamily IA) hydrolase [Cyanobium sp. PCC 7001]|uniref:TIGR01548 family HAD-type hydrolase n=1 Tax=Cyanobium sp. PCC 7001 TaxID=180281 RepID=UPI00018048CC|nr:TIGR01548 family HAD-type hydrolase [Cyanobium sp. PCC 7001]EDY39313.1 HAD superfamily (subfamily IA) hydrolase [Cyanobium sp. PCC 7001]